MDEFVCPARTLKLVMTFCELDLTLMVFLFGRCPLITDFVLPISAILLLKLIMMLFPLFSQNFGKVLSVKHSYFDYFPPIRSGNRLVKILLAEEIRCFVSC